MADFNRVNGGIKYLRELSTDKLIRPKHTKIQNSEKIVRTAQLVDKSLKKPK
jgi:hypothetical protein